MRFLCALTIAFLGLYLPGGPGAKAQALLLSDLADGGRLLPAGTYKIGNRRMRCGNAKTLISSKFWDYGGALPGLIILNPHKMNTLPRRMRMFVYEHECAHQTVGANEARADCTAITKGKRQGWLKRRDVQHICQRLFIHSKGDKYHLPGPQRCRQLMQCYDGRSTTVTANRTTQQNPRQSREIK